MFKVAKFESNNAADTACKELFTGDSIKSRIRKGKTKKTKKRNVVLKHKESRVNNVKDTNRSNLHSKVVVKKVKTRKKSKDVPGRYVSLLNENSQQKIRKRKKKSQDIKNIETKLPLDRKQQKIEKIKEKLLQTINPTSSIPKKPKPRNQTLRERMIKKLEAARFRYINEQIYSSESAQAQKIFTEDPEAFKAYHEGYRQQVSKWPLNPLDVIISNIKKMPKTHIVADFGCGDAKLSKSVNQQVHSFDLVAVNDSVTACDMARVPLKDNSVNVVVFCLSLMGTNLHEYVLEANRVLVIGGVLKIAEVESRFDDVNQFIDGMKKFCFKNTWKDLSHNLFYFLDFKKEANIKNKKKLPSLSLNPCLYKKR